MAEALLCIRWEMTWIMDDGKSSLGQGKGTASRPPLAFLFVFLNSFWSFMICFFQPKHDLQLELPLGGSVRLPRM